MEHYRLTLWPLLPSSVKQLNIHSSINEKTENFSAVEITTTTLYYIISYYIIMCISERSLLYTLKQNAVKTVIL